MRSGRSSAALNSLPIACLGLILNLIPVSELHAQGPTEPRDRHLDLRLIDKTPATSPFNSVLIMKGPTETKLYIRRVSRAQVYPKVDYEGLAATWAATNVHLFKQLDTTDILLAGRSSAGKGALALLRDSATGFAQVGSLYEEAGSRFVGVAYSGKKARVYLLDSWKKRIVYASLSVGATALPTQWTTLITDQTLAALGSANEFALEVYVDGDEPKLGLISRGNSRVSQYWIKDGTNGVQVTLMQLGTGDVAQIVTQPLLVDSLTVRVEAKPGLQVVVTDLVNFTPLGTGVVPPSGTLDVLVPPIAWGQILGAGLLAGPVGPPYQFPYKSWGQAEVLDSNLSIETIGEVEAATAWVDQPHFRATLGIEWQQAPQTPTSYNATLLVGSEQDLVPIGGGQYALLGTGVVAFPTTVLLDATMMPKGVGVVDLPIPNDPMLGGTVTLLQWIVSKSPTEAKISNVAAFFIYPDEFDPDQVPQGMQAFKSTSGAPKTQTRRRPESIFVQQARYKWLVTKNKGVLLSKRARAALRKLLQRK
jgi:hypothetical protein